MGFEIVRCDEIKPDPPRSSAAARLATVEGLSSNSRQTVSWFHAVSQIIIFGSWVQSHTVL
jgi:hypothetical protein